MLGMNFPSRAAVRLSAIWTKALVHLVVLSMTVLNQAEAQTWWRPCMTLLASEWDGGFFINRSTVIPTATPVQLAAGDVRGTVPAVSLVDIYAGYRDPLGRFWFWLPPADTANPNSQPRLGQEPGPRVANRLLGDGPNTLSIIAGGFPFDASTPAGLYQFFCITVPAGTSLLNFQDWGRQHVRLLLVQEAVAR